MTTKETASAAANPVSASNAPIPVRDVKMHRLPMVAGQKSHPAIEFKGKTPKAGEILEFQLDNGITYRGVVKEAVEAGGEVFAEFAGPLKVVPADE